MSDRPTSDPSTQTREERLAQKLRDNLRRRKAQARALGGGNGGGEPDCERAESPETLSKAPPSG